MDDKRKVLYDQLSKDYELGDFDSFSAKLDDESKRKAFYDAVSKEYDLGDYGSFVGKIKKPAAQIMREQSTGEPYTHEYDEQGNLIGGTAYDGKKVEIGDLPTLEQLSNQDKTKDGKLNIGKPGFVQDEAAALYPMSQTSLNERLSDPYIFNKDMSLRAVDEAKEEEEIDKFYVSKPMNTAKDVYDNFSARFTNTKRGIEAGEELFKVTKDIQDKYLKEYLSSDSFKELQSKYQGQELADQANEQFGMLYGEAINNELKPYKTAYNDELERRYGKQIDKELNRINKEEAGSHARELMTSVDSELEDIENRIAARARAVRNLDWKPGMPSSRDDKKLAELRGERAYLEGAKELIDDSQKILNAVESEKDGNFFGGLGRGIRDSAFDIDTWTMGLSDLVGGLRLRTVLEKAERGEKLTSAEERLLDASVNNMAVNFYYRNDLGRGYQAGEITGQSIPFMLEFIVNPVSASGNAIAKSLLNYGMKRFAVGAIGKNAAKVGTRLVGDAIAAGGVTATSGLGNVMSGTVERLNRNYEYGLDEEGNLNVTNTNEVGLGEALAKSATTAFLERQSEMIFNAFKGAPSLFKGVEASLPGGVNTFMNYINNSRVGELWRGIKNNTTMRELAQRAQFHGIGEEYLEEVYNNFANIPLGEMTFEEATDLEKNIVTFLGLAPTQLMFGAIGGISYGVERYKARRDMERTFGRMTEEQKRKLMELQEMGKLSTNRDIAIFLAETIKDESLTPEQKRDEIEYAYNLAKQNAIDEISNTDVEDTIESENQQIDSVTDPSTGVYSEVDRWVVDGETGVRVPQHGYIVGWIGEAPVFLPEGMENTPENRVVLKPNEWNPDTVERMEHNQVKVLNEEMIREESAAQAELESKYAPEVLSAQMQQGVPFNTPTSQIVPVSPMPEGNGWIVEEYAMDTDNKVAKQPIIRELTNDEYRDMLQAQLDAEQAAAEQVAQPSESVGEQVNSEVNTEVNNPMSPMESQESTPTSPISTPMTENVKPQAPVIPTKEDGSIDFVTYGKEGSFKTLGERYGEKMPNKVAVTAKALSEDLKKAQNKLQKAEEAYDNAPIGREQKAEEARDKAQQELEAIQREADFWAEMDADIKAAQAEREAILNPQVEVDASNEPMTADEFVAQQLAAGNIVLNKDDYMRETGFGSEEANAMNGGTKKLLGADGMTIQEAGERLMEMDRENGTNFFDQSDSNAGRDALISVLGSVKSRKELNQYIAENRKEQAEKASEGLRNELERQVMEANYASLEDYVLQMEAAEVDIPFEGMDIAVKDAIFAEAEEEYQSYLKSLENGQGTTEEVAEGSDNVLSEEQSDDTGGTEERQGQVDGTGQRTLQEGESAHVGEQADEVELTQQEGETIVQFAERVAEENRRRPLRERANEWSKALGVKVTFLESIDEVDAETRAEIESAHAKNKGVPGWVNSKGVFFFMPDLQDMKDVDDTYVHEVVAHVGIEKMLGKERFAELCDKVWEMMPQSAKDFYEKKYPGVKDIKNETLRHRRAADEYIAHLAEKENLTPEEKTIWDNIVKLFRDMLDKALNGIIGKSKITDEDISNLIKASYANLKSGAEGNVSGEGTRFSAKKVSERRQDRNRVNNTVDQAVAFVMGKDVKEVKAERLEKEQKRKEEAEEIYQSVLSGDFNDVTLQKINDYIDDATPLHPYGQRISQRLPQKLERGLHEGARTNAVDALFSRICESAVPASRRASEAGRREIEERKKEALKGWAIAANNWHTDLSDFADEEDFIRQGTDSKVYLAKDGKHVIKVSFGKPEGKRFRPDIDTTALFNSVFRNTAYEIVGYGEFDGKFARILKQPFVDFADKTALNADEREEYMRTLGFEPINESRTAFSNGSIIAADLQKSNILKDAAGNISVIDADMKLHTKDVGGNYTYPTVEADLPEGKISFRVVNDKNGKKTLVGLHNISEEKLRKAIKQGGLANPSMAVINMDKQQHVDYGGITLVAPADLIDKKTGKNAGTFTADAYTPIYPSVTKTMSKKGDNKYWDDLQKLEKSLISRVKLYFDNYLDSDVKYDALYYWFLEDTGKNPSIKKNTPEDYSEEELNKIVSINPDANGFYNLNNEEKQKVVDLFIEKQGGREAFEKNLADRKAIMEANLQKPDLKGIFKKKIEQKLKELDEYGYDYNQISDFYSKALNEYKSLGRVDEYSTFYEAKKVVENGNMTSEFEQWLAKKEADYGVEEQLWVGTDKNGRNKYIPNTLENASKLMKKQGLEGAQSLMGFNHFVAHIAPKLGTLKDISKRKMNLTTQAEYDEFTSKWMPIYQELASDLQPDADRFHDYGFYRLEEIVKEKNPKEYVKKEYGIDLSDDFLNKLEGIKDAIKNDFPARYFETKFERPVYLNEFAAAVVPQGTSKDVVDALTDAGLPVEEYEKGNNEARMAAVDKVSSETDGVRFRIAYHGSGVSFDRFDHSFMGTGEGNQSFGWGTYVTDVKAIGEKYAGLKADNSPIAAQTLRWLDENSTYESFIAKGEGSRRMKTIENAREFLEDMKKDGASEDVIKAYEQDLKDAERAITEDGYNQTKENMVSSLNRHLYEVEIPDDNGSNYIAWDKMLPKEQAERIKDAVRNSRFFKEYEKDYGRLAEERLDAWTKTNGGRAYKLLGNIVWNEKDLSEVLLSAGFVGFKYPSNYFAGGNEDGANNYVIFNEDDLKIVEHTRFRIANRNQEIFVSNAQKAVESIKQEKGTPQQWLAMIEKNGGLKAGEDKWLGLSDWLKGSDKKSLTKAEILDFIGENKIRIEEVHYSEGDDIYQVGLDMDQFCDFLAEEYADLLNEAPNQKKYGPTDEMWALDQIARRYGEEVVEGFNIDDEGNFSVYEGQEEIANAALRNFNAQPGEINSTRLNYTTEGIDNKHEIALTVPTIEPWNEYDEIHFGDAGEGRAVAWIRFGETFVMEDDSYIREVTELKEPYRDVNGHDIYKTDSGSQNDFIVHGKGRSGEMIYVAYVNGNQIPVPHKTLEDAVDEMNKYFKEHPIKGRKRLNVLVIDEIQSKRHQEGREKGYKPNPDIYLKENGIDVVESGEFYEFYKNGELDKRFAKSVLNNNINKAKDLYVGGQLKTNIPEAPFEKNWSELAFKRMLRYAAENGYDKVAWTTGAQQAERYGLSNKIDSIEASEWRDYHDALDDGVVNKEVLIKVPNFDEVWEYAVDKEGKILWDFNNQYTGENIANLLGKEIAVRLLSDGKVKLKGDGLRIGGEGMKGFYDKMLPSFVNKYVKKWGTKVQDIELPNVEESGRIMHSVDVTDAMKESVMEGQTMFRISEKGKQIQTEVDKFTSKYNSKPVVASEVNSMTDEDIEDMFDADASEVKDAAEKGMIGGYDEKTDKIYIFAENQTLDDLEDTLFHENLHALFHGNAMIGGFDEASKDKFLKNRANIQKVYKEDMWAEEMFVKVAADAMAKGDFKYIEKYLPDEYKEEFYNTIKDFGYEREEESERRRIVRPGTGGQVEGQEVSPTDGLDKTEKESQERRKLSPRDRKERLTDLFNKVADMGLDGVLGNKAYTSAMVDIYKELPEDARVEVAEDALRNYGGSVAPAVSDYLNIKGEASLWDKVVGIVKDALRKVGLDVELNNNDVKYILWRSRKQLDRSNLVDVAEDIDMRYRLKVGEYNGSPTDGGNIYEGDDNASVKFRVVSDKSLIEELESSEKRIGYRNVVLNADGSFGSPMADKLGKTGGNKRKTSGFEIGKWEQAEENPDLVDENGKIDLIKPDGKQVKKVDYNPYIHNRLNCVNRQFRQAWERLDLVYVETEIPLTDIESGYHAPKAKKPVGEHKWNGGNLILSRYDKPIRIVGWEEVANDWVKTFKKVGVHFDIVPPALLPILVKRGVKILPPHKGMGEDCNKAYQDFLNNTPTPDGGGTRFRVDVESKLNIRDEYEATIKKGSYQTREAVQDAMLSLRRVQELIEKASGKKLRDFENAWMHENRLSSVVQSAIHEMERKFYKPMMEAVKKLMDSASLEQYEVADYLMLKHGIERNREMAVRKALTDSEGKIDRDKLNDWYEEKRRIRKDASLDTWRKKQEAMDDAALMFGADMSRDYSGLTSMFDTDDLADCTERAYNEVEALEDAHPAETEALGKAIKAMTQNTLDESFGSGLMNKAVYEELSNDMYDYYIPLRGFEEKTSEEVYAYLDQDRGAFNAPLKRAKGRSSKSDNPLAYLKSIAESGIMQGERNKMKQTFLNMVTNHPSDLVSVREGVWAIYNPATGEWEAASFPESLVPRNATPADVEAAYEKWEEDMELRAKTDPNVKKISEAADVPYRVIGNRMNQHQVIVKRLGKSYTLTINGNPRLAMALNGLTNPNNTSNDGKVSAFVSGKIDALNRSLAAWYTTRNPDFVASNFMRDTFYTNTIVRAKEGNEYANKFHKNYAMALPKMLSLFRKYENGTLDPANQTEAAFMDFMMNGGETGYSNLKDLEHIKKQIAKELKGNRFAKVEKVAESLDILNRAVENTARFAAFLTSREMGRSIAKSVFDAKEISVNFNKKGAGGTFFGMTGQTWFGNLGAMVGAGGRALYVFFNAAIQGSTNLLHVMKVNPKGTSAGLTAMFLMGAVVPFLFGGDDDEEKSYYDLPEHVRRNHLILPGAGDAWVSIPLPIEYRIMYGMGELLTSWRTGHERGKDIARKMLGMTGQALPLNFLEEGVDAFMPSALSPLWQVYNNRSWTGLPIYKDNEFNKDDPEYTKAYRNVDKLIYNFTKSMYEWTFDEENQEAGINLNPAVIESLAKGYFGGLATQLSNIVKTYETVAGEREFDWRSIPIGNRIFKTGDERTKEKRVTNEYFENMEKLDFLQSRERLLKKTINGSEVPQLDKDKAKIDDETMRGSDIYKKYQEFKRLKKRVDKIRKVMKDNGSTPEREKDLIEAQEAANKAVR